MRESKSIEFLFYISIISIIPIFGMIFAKFFGVLLAVLQIRRDRVWLPFVISDQ